MKSNKYLYHLPHDKCGSSDGLAVYQRPDGSFTGYCFVCGYFTNNPLNTISKNPPRPAKAVNKNLSSIEKIFELPCNDLKSRGISSHVAQIYGVRVEYSEEFGEEKKYYFPVTKNGVITGFHVRELPKSFFNIGDVSGNIELFGQSTIQQPGKLIIITEGCEDCLAAKQMLLEMNKDYRVVSLPNGASWKAVQNNYEYLNQYKAIILCLDQDEPGRRCAEKIAQLFPIGKVRIASLSEKDANDMLRKGKSKEFLQAIFNSQPHKPDDIICASDIIDDVLKKIEPGLPWPWSSLTQITFGRRRKELYGFGGGTGSGKTEVFKEIISHIVYNEGNPVGCVFLEEAPALTIKAIAGKISGKRYHIPDEEYDVNELRTVVEDIKDKIYIYNHFGQKDWDTIKTKIRYMVAGLGIKDIFLDHLTALVASEMDVNKALEQIMPDLASLVQELDFTLYFISHLATPVTGKPHEEGGRVTVAQFRGSRTIGFWSHFLFGLERDQQAESETDRNVVNLRVLKDRYTGLSTGKVIPLYYNSETGRLHEDLDI